MEFDLIGIVSCSIFLSNLLAITYAIANIRVDHHLDDHGGVDIKMRQTKSINLEDFKGFLP